MEGEIWVLIIVGGEGDKVGGSVGAIRSNVAGGDAAGGGKLGGNPGDMKGGAWVEMD